MSDVVGSVMRTQGAAAVILIRLLVGLVVFFPEGIQKLIFPDILGAGRFARIGIPFPDPWARSSGWSKRFAVF